MSRQVTIARILAICDPVRDPPWHNCASLTPKIVRACLARRHLVSTHVGPDSDCLMTHAGRIAWLVENPDTRPIHIDVGVLLAPSWIIEDGNHRLYAAWMRGDDTISAEISGSYEKSLEMLGLYPDDSTPEEGIIPRDDGRLFEVASDGRTIWVNADDGMLIGRFSQNGIEVHHGSPSNDGDQAIPVFKQHGVAPCASWDVFTQEIEAHHRIVIPDSYRPDYARPDDHAPSP